VQSKAESPRPKAESPRGKMESTDHLMMKKAGQPEQVVRYSGFFTDLSRTNQPLKFLNLRQPLDPIHDTENLHPDMRPGRLNAFRLFSIDF